MIYLFFIYKNLNIFEILVLRTARDVGETGLNSASSVAGLVTVRVMENEMLSRGQWLAILPVISPQIATSTSSFSEAKSQEILAED